MGWTLQRRNAGIYVLTIAGQYSGDVVRKPWGPCPWVVWYARREGRWREFEDFFTLREAKAWIGAHLKELAKGHVDG